MVRVLHSIRRARAVDADAIAAADGLREVFASGGAKVYEIVER